MLRFAVALAAVIFLAVPAHAQETRTVAGTFDFGYVGRQGKNTGVMDDARSFQSLGLRIAFFVFDAGGYDGTQGNDINGFIRLITQDGQLVDVSGAINWQVKANGKTRFIGMIPTDLATPNTISTPIGPYTFDANSTFAIRLPGFTDTYANGSTIKGAANPPDIGVIPTREVVTKPGPPTLNTTRDITVVEGTIDVATYSTDEWVSWVFSGGADKALFDLDPETGLISFLQPQTHLNPADADADNVYLMEITAWDVDGDSSTQSLSVTVTPKPVDITSTKTIQIISPPDLAFDCAVAEAIPGAVEAIPGACIQYVIEIVSAPGDFGTVDNLLMEDVVPSELMQISIFASSGFDEVTLNGSTVAASILSFAPGDVARVTIRALIR